VTDQLAEPGLDAPDVADVAAHSGPATTAIESSLFQRWRQRRMARWDRPPDPHDWRFFVGGLGRILIITGLLMFGFVAYQLWGTGIETAKAQNSLENQFEQQLAANRPGSPPNTVATAATVATGTIATATQPVAVAGTAAPLDTSPTASDVQLPPVSAATASVPPGGAGGAPVAEPPPLPPVERGQVLFRLEIPRMAKVGDDALYVVPGVALTDLKKGPGHYPDTPLPGQLGNASVAGHRTTWGEPFRHIDQLVPGDEIIVTMLNGEQYVYDVTDTEIVGPADYFVVTTQDPTVAMLTLTSCHPVFTSKQRIAVHAVLDPSRSGIVTPPQFYTLDPAPEPDPTETVDSVVDEAPAVTDPTAATVSVPVLAEPAATVPGDTKQGPVATAPGASTPAAQAPADPQVAARPQVEDAFSQGWFHDKAAFAQIALWGAVLTAIALIAYRVARRFRRTWVGYAVGSIPFVVSLYFFYQNVNRLLPPGL
jgi:sortase A